MSEQKARWLTWLALAILVLLSANQQGQIHDLERQMLNDCIGPQSSLDDYDADEREYALKRPI